MRWMKVWLAVLLGVQGFPAAAQTAGVLIRGRVIDADTREAVRRAVVKVYNARDRRDEITDAEGRFQFSDLAAGDYALIAHRDGYSNRAYKLERSDFDDPKELLVEVRRQGVITGRVRNTEGEPLQRATIQALIPQGGDGAEMAGPRTETNDLGEYRLSGLEPGTYRVKATFREGRRSPFHPMPLLLATSYYGSPAGPTEIAIKHRSVVTGVDFVLSPARPASVRGRLRTENGVFRGSVSLWIEGHNAEVGKGGSGAEGKFEIGELAPGRYTILAQTRGDPAPKFGLATVEVGVSDVENVELVLRPMTRIEAEIRIEGGGPVRPPGSVYFSSIGGSIGHQFETGRPDERGKFSLALVPGDYRATFDSSADSSAVSLVVRSVSLDDEPTTMGRIRIGESPEPKKLVIVMAPGPRP